MSLPATTWQTVGPYFRLGCDPLNCSEMAAPGVAGDRITIQGRVLDGNGDGVPDAMLEIWQANANGKYPHPEDLREEDLQEKNDKERLPDANFSGFGRIPTDEQGMFKFSTIKPGPVPGPDGKVQAPHLVVSIFMRGLLIRLVTRIYFANGLQNNDPHHDADYVLSLVSPERRATLMASPMVGDQNVLEWNVVLQGTGETVFFDI